MTVRVSRFEQTEWTLGWVKECGVMAGELNEEPRELNPGLVQPLIIISQRLSRLVYKMEEITSALQVFTYRM